MTFETQITKDYINQNMAMLSDKKIAKHIGCCWQTIQRIRLKSGSKRKAGNNRPNNKKCAEIIEMLVISKYKKSIIELAKNHDVGVGYVSRCISKYLPLKLTENTEVRIFKSKIWQQDN